MAAQRSQSSGSVLAKVKNAINPLAKKHAEDDVDYGFQTLPGGIRNGIARLTDAYFDIYKEGKNQGQPYLRMVGVCVEPEFHDGERVRDVQTSLMVAICPRGEGDRAKTLEDAVAEVQNELKKLGADPSSLEDTDSWEATVKQLAEDGPYFYFSTRESPETLWDTGPNKGQVKYKARVWESWRGIKGLEDFTPESGGTGSGMEQAATSQSQPQAAPAPKQSTPQPPPKTQAAPAKQPPITHAAKSPPPPVVTADEYRDDADLDSLAERADGGDDDAITAMTEAAEKAGVTEEQIAAVSSWKEVVEIIKGGSSGGGQEAGGEEVPFAVDEIYKYHARDAKGQVLKDPKTKKPLNPEEVVIVAVDADARTVDLKFNKTKKIVKGVPFDDVVRDE